MILEWTEAIPLCVAIIATAAVRCHIARERYEDSVDRLNGVLDERLRQLTCARLDRDAHRDRAALLEKQLEELRK